MIAVGSSSWKSINLTHLELRDFQMFFILDSFCLSNILVSLNIQNRYIHQTFIDNRLYILFQNIVWYTYNFIILLVSFLLLC